MTIKVYVWCVCCVCCVCIVASGKFKHISSRRLTLSAHICCQFGLLSVDALSMTAASTFPESKPHTHTNTNTHTQTHTALPDYTLGNQQQQIISTILSSLQYRIKDFSPFSNNKTAATRTHMCVQVGLEFRNCLDRDVCVCVCGWCIHNQGHPSTS